MRVQLIGAVSRHVALERQALLTPGASPGFTDRRKPGVHGPGASWGSPNGGEIDRQWITGTPPRQATNLRARETGGSLTPGATPALTNRAQARGSRTGPKPAVHGPGASWGSPNGAEIARQWITGTPPSEAT